MRLLCTVDIWYVSGPDRSLTIRCVKTSMDLQNRPVHRCVARQFWPSCCWSPGRNGLCAGRRRQLPRPSQPLLYQLTAKSHRSLRPAVWSPQVRCSFSDKKYMYRWVTSPPVKFLSKNSQVHFNSAKRISNIVSNYINFRKHKLFLFSLNYQVHYYYLPKKLSFVLF